MSHAALGLAPDFRSGRFVVRQGVVSVVVLVWHEVLVRVFIAQAMGQFRRSVGALHRVGDVERRTQGQSQLLALLAGTVGDRQFHEVALQLPVERHGNTRIARRGIQDHFAWDKLPVTPTRVEHAQSGAILDRAARVVPLRFRPDLDARTDGCPRLNTDQRRVPHASKPEGLENTRRRRRGLLLGYGGDRR